jgi:signal transduction histidine kinase
MLTIIVKLLLLSFGILAQIGETSEIPTVILTYAVLSALTLTSFNQYLRIKKFTAVSSVLYFTASIFYPTFALFIPLFCFDLFNAKLRPAAAFAIIPFITFITHVSSSISAARESVESVYLFLLIMLALFLQYMCEKISALSKENKRIRDDGSELNHILMDKNRSLIEKQNYEIHLVTLKERNRIAREIHDNVGHILSRSLLQTGALQAINKDELLSGHLSGLKDTLSLAMDSIRNSVHGLRDESFDLHESIRKMTEQLQTEQLQYEINIEYDVTQDSSSLSGLSNDIKYCFLTVLKEALTNISRHSDASRIRISVQEHPAIYQLLIHDNGTKNPFLSSVYKQYKDKNGISGMGLVNMEERVSAFKGHFSASYQNGFRIFISIPKQSE